MDLHSLQEEYGTAGNQWQKLVTKRTSLESTWKDCAKLTLPYIFPEENQDEAMYMPTPYNSIGPSGVNALASKLLLSLLPPTGTFFRLMPYEELIEGIEPEELKAIDAALSKIEQDVVATIDTQGLRVTLFEALKQLVVTGNVLLYKVPGKSYKVHSPYEYVVQRDFVGNVTKIIIKESISESVLPTKIIEQLELAESEDKSDKDKDEKTIYTCILREGPNKFLAYQEIDGIVLEETIKSYTEDLLPYLPLRWTNVNNEDYGRGLVEQYLGDLRSLEGLSQIIVEGSAIMSKVIFGKRPASTTSIEDLANARNGEFIVGDLEKDITTLRVDKASDFNIPYQLMQSLEARLAKAFLMMNTRDSERTTATEVRANQNELNAVLGGTFSVLAQEFQLPTLRLLLNEIEPKASKIADPAIVSGISSISREKDLENLNMMAQSIAAFGPEAIAQYMDLKGYFTQLAVALGIDPEVVVKSEEQIAQDQAQMQAQQQAQQQPQGM